MELKPPTKWPKNKWLDTLGVKYAKPYRGFPGSYLVQSQWLFLVPLKGGIGGIVHPPIGREYTTYSHSPCRTWGVI